MSNKKRKKAGIQAKQRSMERAGEAGGKAEERQTEGLDDVVRERSSIEVMRDAKQTKNAVNRALADVAAGDEIDPRLVQLFRDFKRYRIIVVVIVAIGFAILLASMGMYHEGMIGEEMQNNLIIFANIIIVVGMVVAFGRARPIREDINAWNRVNEIALAQSGGTHGATQADIDKIFYSRARNKRVPPTPEFKRIRRVWYALLVIASLLIIAAALLARQNMSDITVPVIVLIVSFVLLLIATFIERTRMKPLREAWAAELDAQIKKASKAKKRK